MTSENSVVLHRYLLSVGVRFDSASRSKTLKSNIMQYKRIEDVLENKTKNYDSKHILNLAPNKIIPNDVLERLRKDGLTIEQIDRLQDEGYPVCHYETQITIHGIVANELAARRTANGYVTLVRNQNKSLGVRWIAVDEEKRKRIFTLLRHYGWGHQHNSSCDYYYKVMHLTKEAVEMLKSEEARIDKSLFFGRTDLYRAGLYGMNYIILECHVNGIYEKNIKGFTESMTGVSFEEMEETNRKFVADANKRWEEEKRQREIETAELQKKRDEWKKNNPMPSDFVEMLGSDLQSGDVVCSIEDTSNGCRFAYRLIYKAGGYICARPCMPDGSLGKFNLARGSAVRNLKRTYFVRRLQKETKETPKPMPKVSETARKEPSRIEIKDYKNAILITGDTRPMKDKLKYIGGLWNSRLGGWIFPKSKRGEVEKLLS